MKVLVTGASGFLGRHLVPRLMSRGWEVWGLSRHPSPFPGAVGDLENAEDVERQVRDVRPDAVVHLAAVSSVRLSWEDPQATFRTNVLGTLHLLEAVRRVVPQALLLSVGSAEEYGDCPSLPCREDHPARPVNPYGVSKLAQGMLVCQWSSRYRLHAVHLRLFSVVGPGQPRGFFLGDLGYQVARAERERAATALRVGNLAVKRDFLDVRDAAAALEAALASPPPPGTYNVCRGEPLPLQAVAESLLSLARVRCTLEVDPSLVRPVDVAVQWGDSSRFREAVPWNPSIPLSQTLEDILRHWRDVLARPETPGEGT